MRKQGLQTVGFGASDEEEVFAVDGALGESGVVGAGGEFGDGLGERNEFEDPGEGLSFEGAVEGGDDEVLSGGCQT